MNKGFGNNLNNNSNYLLKDIELGSQTKKAIILAREGDSQNLQKYIMTLFKKESITITLRLAGIYERLGKRQEARMLTKSY